MKDDYNISIIVREGDATITTRKGSRALSLPSESLDLAREVFIWSGLEKLDPGELLLAGQLLDKIIEARDLRI